MTLHPWQEKIIVDIESGGLKPGEMSVMMAGRRTGKSMFKNFYQEMQVQPAIRILDQAQVDGETWYTVQCKPSLVSGWLQEQDPALWHRHEDVDKRWYVHFNVFDVHEKLYSMLQLRWA